jgi:tetrahydromethanopterin S-methyltransferase subunit F
MGHLTALWIIGALLHVACGQEAPTPSWALASRERWLHGATEARRMNRRLTASNPSATPTPFTNVPGSQWQVTATLTLPALLPDEFRTTMRVSKDQMTTSERNWYEEECNPEVYNAIHSVLKDAGIDAVTHIVDYWYDSNQPILRNRALTSGVVTSGVLGTFLQVRWVPRASHLASMRAASPGLSAADAAALWASRVRAFISGQTDGSGLLSDALWLAIVVLSGDGPPKYPTAAGQVAATLLTDLNAIEDQIWTTCPSIAQMKDSGFLSLCTWNSDGVSPTPSPTPKASISASPTPSQRPMVTNDFFASLTSTPEGVAMTAGISTICIGLIVGLCFLARAHRNAANAAIEANASARARRPPFPNNAFHEGSVLPPFDGIQTEGGPTSPSGRGFTATSVIASTGMPSSSFQGVPIAEPLIMHGGRLVPFSVSQAGAVAVSRGIPRSVAFESTARPPSAVDYSRQTNVEMVIEQAPSDWDRAGASSTWMPVPSLPLHQTAAEEDPTVAMSYRSDAGVESVVSYRSEAGPADLANGSHLQVTGESLDAFMAQARGVPRKRQPAFTSGTHLFQNGVTYQLGSQQGPSVEVSPVSSEAAGGSIEEDPSLKGDVLRSSEFHQMRGFESCDEDERAVEAKPDAARADTAMASSLAERRSRHPISVSTQFHHDTPQLDLASASSNVGGDGFSSPMGPSGVRVSSQKVQTESYHPAVARSGLATVEERSKRGTGMGGRGVWGKRSAVLAAAAALRSQPKELTDLASIGSSSADGQSII